MVVVFSYIPCALHALRQISWKIATLTTSTCTCAVLVHIFNSHITYCFRTVNERKQVNDVHYRGTIGIADMRKLTNVNAAVIIDNWRRENEFLIIALTLK